MPIPILLLPILVVAAQAAPADGIVVTGYAGRPFISPMGEPFRARTSTEDALARWFRGADRNNDGMLTTAEMQADASRFFATLDTDGDGEIDPDELIRYEWDVAPEIQVNSRLRRSRAAAAAARTKLKRGDDEEDGIPAGAGKGLDADLQGAARYALLNIPEPVSAADANLDRSITLSEFKQASAERFQLLDSNRQGKLSLEGLEALLPPEPMPGHRPKRPKDSTDSRYGVPLPPRN